MVLRFCVNATTFSKILPSTIQQTLIEYLLCAIHCARGWGHNDKQGGQVTVFPGKRETRIITGNRK